MKKLYLLLLLPSLLLAGCGKESPAPDEPAFDIEFDEVWGDGMHLIQNVRVVLSNGNTATLAQSRFSQFGFTLNLPATVDDKLLTYVPNDDDIVATDPDARWTGYVVFSAVNEKGASLGVIQGVTAVSTSSSYYIEYVYADRDVNIKGVYTATIIGNDGPYEFDVTYDMKLKKGWNKVTENIGFGAQSKVTFVRISHTQPVDTIWVYFGNDGGSARSAGVYDVF